MKAIVMKTFLACMVTVAMGLASQSADAQCSTCATPQVTYSPVVYNTTTYDGWYLGKYVGRWSRNLFGSAPPPATYASYSTPTTYAAAYAPATYSVSYAPTCSTCCSSPCGCQTTYRPVIMQPLTSCSSCTACSACNTCSSCSGVVQAGYNAPASSSCPTCATGTTTTMSSEPAPALGNSSPPPTFRETDRVEPTPADETSIESSASDLNAPLLLNPNDQITKRPTAPVWTAVYKQPATISTVKALPSRSTSAQPKVGWAAGR